MFKERGLATLKMIGLLLLYFVAAIAFFAFMYWIMSINLKASETITNCIIGIFFSVLVGMFCIYLLAYAYRFIYWQFIEPFKEWRRKKHLNKEG